jgi:hypothetical protein
MLKGCIPALNDPAAVKLYYNSSRLLRIRRIYLAMIAEFDAMVR